MGKDLSKVKTTFFFCDGGSCQKAGSEEAARGIRAYLRNSGSMDIIHSVKTRCNGRCEDAPTMIVQDGNYWYKNLNAKIGIEIAKSHINKQEPVEAYLLYQPEYNSVNSENERGAFKLKPFESKIDQDLGNCLIMKGFSSDQYLYPLFLYLVDNPEEATLLLVDGSEIPFSEIKELRYGKKFALELDIEKETIEFVMASIPKDRVDLVPLKISSTEYFFQEKTNSVGLRFKNNKGEVLGAIHIGKKESKAWHYCVEFQLQGNEFNITTV